ncbi:MAG: hypothetical protein DMF69_17145 [Acidobacteria bacterium]|nr:MAG: hypothetical protein DMF69_17145 [Acidobacteriota bacterium]
MTSIHVKSWARYASLAVIPSLLLLASCSSKSKTAAENSSPEQTLSSPPFQTKEPENYQAVRTLTFTDQSGKSVVMKTTIAKFGVLRREETQTGTSATVQLELAEGNFVLYPHDKVYAQVAGFDSETKTDSSAFETSPEKLLHPDALQTAYQKLGKETVSGRSLIKYRVVVNSADAPGVSSNETFIWIDETLGMPVRSETKANDGTVSTMELSNVSTQVEKGLFQLPAGYQKIAAKELRRRIAGTR